MLESLANLFYDPLFFWGLPLLIAVALEVARRLRGKAPAIDRLKSRHNNLGPR